MRSVIAGIDVVPRNPVLLQIHYIKRDLNQILDSLKNSGLSEAGSQVLAAHTATHIFLTLCLVGVVASSYVVFKVISAQARRRKV